MKSWWVRVVSLPRFAAFVRARLSPESELGLLLTLGVLLAIGATWLFGGVAEDVVTGDPLTAIDAQIALWFHAHATPAVTLGMLFVTHLHGTTGLSVLALVLGLYLFWKKEGYWFLSLAVVLPAGTLINVLLKQVFLRDRPNFTDPILTLASYSFPSGHVAGATLFYGILAAFLCSRLRSWGRRWLIVLVACTMVVLVGVTRLYLGVHYFSDVVAAAAWATAWLALCLTGIAALRQHRKTRRGART